ncbi:SubName: Full=Uncharacterized protein {ECO:0000313/EMBL:CCA70124.1} [Serendipita indica DSM 11827]|nr:SubName: Full=Uncharacterized protein {ECO:0000313/EMBL:CCA70124.1} [Serendipita indica DSM 11827]
MADQHQIYKLFDVDKRGPQRQGMVTINKSDTVGDLQHKIQAFPRYKDVDPSDLKLFQVDVLDTEDLEQELAKKITALGRPLRPTRLKIPYILSCAWNPSRVQRKREDSPSAEDPETNRRKNLANLAKANLSPPSCSVKKMLAQYQSCIDINLPTADPETIPISLLHEVFGTFLDSYQTHQPTA